MRNRIVVIAAVILCAGLISYRAHADLTRPAAGINQNLTVEDFGDILLARTVTHPIIYRHPETDALHIVGSLEAMNGLTADDGMLGEPYPFMVFDLNLETGDSRLAKGLTGRTSVPYLAPNGKIYFHATRPAELLEYDPVTGEARNMGLLTDDFYAGVQSWVEGPDNKLYYGMFKLHVVSLDLDTGELEDFGNVTNGKFENGYVYHIGVDDRYAHCQLMGYGAEGFAVLDIPERKSYYFTRDEYNEGINQGEWTSEDEPVVFAGPKPTKVRFSTYRELPEGKMWALNNAADVGLEIDMADSRPNNWNGGVMTIRWRELGEQDWREARIEDIPLAPNSVKRLIALPDGNLIGMSSFYGIMFTYNPVTREPKYLGPAPGSVYDMAYHDNHVYFCGYSAMFADFDLDKPWTLQNGGPVGIEPNPIKSSVGGKYNYHMTIAGDGCVYFAGTHSRHSTGSSLDVYDPANPGESQRLLRDELLEHFPSDLIAINEGNKLVMGYGRELILFDVAERTISERITLPEDIPSAGRLLDAGPDMVMGLVRSQGEEDEQGVRLPIGVLYKINVNTGETDYVKTIDGKVFNGVLKVDLQSGDQRFAQGPDGCGWLFVDEYLTRIDPRDGRVDRIMKMEKRGRMFFAGEDLYIYNGGRQFFGGFAGIIRIRDLFEN